MKFLEKFVLLPLERYERLLKGDRGEKKSLNDSVSVIQKNTPIIDPQNSIQISSLNSETSVDKKKDPESDNPQTESLSTTKLNPGNSISQTNNSSKIKSVSENIDFTKTLHKIPARPPGIPNKKQKLKFKWESLF